MYYVYVCMYQYVSVCMYVCVCECMYVCMYVYMYVCMYGFAIMINLKNSLCYPQIIQKTAFQIMADVFKQVYRKAARSFTDPKHINYTQ